MAATNDVQTLDVPVQWSFGRHRVGHLDFALREDQAAWAAVQLEMTATCVLAGAIRDAILSTFQEPKGHECPNLVNAYQISRHIRNAFSHSMVSPRWSIDKDCRERTFAIDDLIALNTTNLHDKPLDWRDYGGLLAIFHFGRFVRERVLGNPVDPDRRMPRYPTRECSQLGRLVVRRIDEIPATATLVASAGSGETLDLGDGYVMTGRGSATLFRKPLA